jgi:hypothetical protein
MCQTRRNKFCSKACHQEEQAERKAARLRAAGLEVLTACKTCNKPLKLRQRVYCSNQCRYGDGRGVAG